MADDTHDEGELKGWGDFSTPFFAARYPEQERLNRQLRDYFLSLEAEGERYRNPVKTPSNQVEIFESPFELFNWDEPCVQELRKFCMGHLWKAMATASGYSAEDCRQFRVFVDSWFHVTHFGGYISYHTHPMASWSGVYMVDPGGDAVGSDLGGVLNFKDPRPHANMYLDPGNRRWQRPYHMGSINYPMKPGELMLFPSFLQHEVTPYMGREPRITVAFNCSFRDPKPGSG